MPRADPQVAVLVDGENVASCHAPEILRIARSLGTAQTRRVYGNLCRIPTWEAMPGFRAVHSGTGKNAADLLIAIDAMEIACAGACDVFLLASSDCDFRHIAIRLREHGKRVIGVGEEKAPDGFRHACSAFRTLATEREAALECGPREPTELDCQIRSMIAANSTKGTGMPITELNVQMARNHGNKISRRPERTWRRYFAARTGFFELDPRGPEARVRFLPRGFDRCDG